MIPANFVGLADGYLDFVMPLGVNVIRHSLRGDKNPAKMKGIMFIDVRPADSRMR